MADEIIRTIYKLEIDDSGYIRGVESLSASTQRLAQNQDAANKRLQENEAALKKQLEIVERSKKALADFTGTDIRQKAELQRALKTEQDAYVKMQELVGNVRRQYEAANKAAQDFANTSQRAANLQTQPGARVGAPIVSPGAVPDIASVDIAPAVAATSNEFDELVTSIQGAETALNGMNEESEEFKTLKPIVEQGKVALQQFEQAADAAGGSTLSLRTQIRQGREELVRLEQQGKANTKEYFELEKQVARLTDAFGDQQQRIKILASDTKLLDFGKGAITAATSAFQAYTAVSILAGDQSEELQKKTLQLFAAMQLLQSLEQLSNLTRREGVLATLAQSGAQATYTAVVGASTGALRAFRIALAATGVGAIIAGIAFLVVKFQELAEAQREAEEAQRLLLEINQEAIKSFAAEVTHLTLIRGKLNDLSIPQKERIRLAKEYNKTADEGNKIDLTQINNIALVNAAIDTQIKKIEQRARARAAENVLTQRFEQLFLAQEAAREKAQQREDLRRLQNLQTTQPPDQPQLRVGDVVPLFDPKTGKLKDVKLTEKDIKEFQEAAVDANVRIANQLRASGVEQAIANDPDVKAAQAAVNKALSLGLINVDDLITPTTGTTDTKKIENVFAQRLRELQAKLAEVTAKSFESEGTIREQFRLSLEKEIAAINDLLKDKKLTAAQSEILIDLTTRINDVQLQEALDQFNQKVTDARNKLNEDLRNIQQQNTEDQINLLQDEFERRRLLIDFNEKQQLEDAAKNTAARLAALEQQRNLVGEQQYQDAKNTIVQQGEDAQTNIIIDASLQRQQLAQDSFKKSLDFFQNAINEIDLIDDQDSAKEIRALSDKFLRQEITFTEFQKRLERIQRDFEAKKRNRDLLIERGELDALDFKLTQIEDKTSAHYKEILRLRDEQAKKIAGLEATDAIQDARDENEDINTRQVSQLNDYVQSVGQFTDAIIQFWASANEAEQAALDRSIAIQERRVDAAQRIAARGNAEYLAAEEDRLKELQVARENAARRQLGIDAALQASQILVGITGAIAKIATPGIGIAEMIGSIAAIVGALATGYGLVRSLQGNQPTFFVGTKDTGKGGKQDEKGGFHAVLHPHEAVIPADRNKAYKPTIEAVYDKKIPPEVINNFVKNYHTIKPVAQVNYERIKEAAELKVTHDSKMATILNEHSSLLRENNDLQKAILRKQIKVEQHIDRDGVAAMVTEYLEQKRINKHI